MRPRHEIPTHLAVEDRVLAGLTMPQLLVLLGGGSGAYAAWQHVTVLDAGARLTLAGAILTSAAAAALFRPQGHSVFAWTHRLGRYHAMPRLLLWRPEADGRAGDATHGMLPFAPVLAWADGRATPAAAAAGTP